MYLFAISLFAMCCKHCLFLCGALYLRTGKLIGSRTITYVFDAETYRRTGRKGQQVQMKNSKCFVTLSR